MSLSQVIKRASIEAMNAEKPVNVGYGKVISISPLVIETDKKLPLPAEALVLCRAVTDYETQVTVDWLTSNVDGHLHSVSGKKAITIHNALQVGDVVVLAKIQGGQQYLVIDRVG